jgi:NAD+ synthase
MTREIGMERLGLDAVTTERTLLAFLRDECASAGLRRGVVGLSGGVDSAVVCFLAARALGPENVTGVMMPARSSEPKSLTDARVVAEATGVRSRVVEIGEMADGFLKLVPDADDIRKGNVFARCRMIVLYDVSAEVRGLVLGTSNRSEILLGYGTLHGDLACAINPIGNLYKTQVRVLAEHLGVPDSIRRKPPSADLWIGQTDEGELGTTYERLDDLLVRLVDDRISPERLIEDGMDPEFVRSTEERVRRNRFKGRPPVIAKLSTRTIGPETRLPRDAARSRRRRPESDAKTERSQE